MSTNQDRTTTQQDRRMSVKPGNRDVETLTTRGIAALACKILALYAVFLALRPLADSLTYIVEIGAMMHGIDNQGINPLVSFAAGFAAFILFLVPALLLWRWADRVGGQMVLVRETSVGASRITRWDLQAIAFSTVGLVVIVDALPRVAVFVYAVLFNLQSYPMIRSIPEDGAEAVIRLALGIGLLCGSRRLLSVLKRGR